MAATLDEQLGLHDAAELCSVALMRPGSLTPEELEPIIGLDLRPSSVLEALAPALDTAWPERPEEVGDLEGFLRHARTRDHLLRQDVGRR
jgi:hypothetical protein